MKFLRNLSLTDILVGDGGCLIVDSDTFTAQVLEEKFIDNHVSSSRFLEIRSIGTTSKKTMYFHMLDLLMKSLKQLQSK